MKAVLKSLAVALTGISLSISAVAQSQHPSPAPNAGLALPLWLAESDIQQLRGDPRRTEALRKRCDRELDVVAQPVDVYEPPPHYTTQGVTENSSSRNFAGDGNMAWRAALCYAASGDVRYARHSQAILSAWGDRLVSVKSEQGAAEINFDLPTYVLAASLVHGVEGWNDASFRRLLVKTALPLSHIDRSNNHANWGVLLDATIAAYIGDPSLLSKSRARWLVLMDHQVAADGSLPLEVCRSDTIDWCGGAHQGINGLSYTHYTLMPTTAAGRVFEMQGAGVWQTPQGQKLASAYRRAAVWTLHPEQFPYFERNGGKLNGVCNAAYFALLQRIYPDGNAKELLEQGHLGMDGLEWLEIFR